MLERRDSTRMDYLEVLLKLTYIGTSPGTNGNLFPSLSLMSISFNYLITLKHAWFTCFIPNILFWYTHCSFARPDFDFLMNVA